jgi:hypothetical protein
MSHPNCSTENTCQQPSGRVCIERGCGEEAGTLWGPLWCPDHDRERLDRISLSLDGLAAAFGLTPDPTPARVAATEETE